VRGGSLEDVRRDNHGHQRSTAVQLQSHNEQAKRRRPGALGQSFTKWHARGPTGSQVGHVVGEAVASTCSLMMRRLLAIVLRNLPRISGSSNRIAPRAWVSITSSSLVLAGATGANVARACSVNGPNRDTSVKLLTGSYSVTSMLPSTRRPRSVRTSRAVVPTPIGPGTSW
jgi:hypothetical protein